MNAPPSRIPPDLMSRFLMGSQVRLEHQYCDDSVASSMIWSKEMVDAYIAMYASEVVNSGQLKGETYPGASALLHRAISDFPVDGQEVAVLGSLTPWIEAILLSRGARHVTTVEYNVPPCHHDSVTTRSFEWLQKSQVKFDTIVTFSSVEHSGLGRYGDPLDPEGDKLAMEVLRSHLMPEGHLLWGAPVARHDVLVWNAHRIYGPARLRYLFRGFEVMSTYHPPASAGSLAKKALRAVACRTVPRFRRRRFLAFTQPLIVLRPTQEAN